MPHHENTFCDKSRMADKIRVDGIKLSLELIQINILAHQDNQRSNKDVLRYLAENRINCPLIFYSAGAHRIQGAYCVLAEEADRLNRVLDVDPDLKKIVEILSPVGALSLFPHKFSLTLLGCLMNVFGKAGLPIYGMAASLSALTLTTDYEVLDHAIELLRPHISLPANHSPFRPQLRIKAI